MHESTGSNPPANTIKTKQPKIHPKQGDSSVRQVVLASFIGTTIEWYDFFIYGTAAAFVFNKLFFPTIDPLMGTLSSFATFAVGFVSRPLGGVLFGHYGDRIGRKTMLVQSLLIMGIATFVIGLLPTYHTSGAWAPALLVILRFAQGIGVGGEWGGAVLMAVEHSPHASRGFHGAWPQMGVPAGLLLSTAIFSLVSYIIPEQQFLSWGWRLPFLLSFVLVGVGLFVRLRLLESPAFITMKETGEPSRRPLLEALREYPKNVLLAIGMRFAQNGAFYIFTVFVLSYGENQLKVPKSIMLTGVMIASIIGLVAIPAYGALSDRVGRRPVYLVGACFMLLYAFPFFWLLNTRSTGLIWLAIALGVNIGHDAMYGPQASYFSELFGTRVRYSGASLSYQLSSVFSGGFAPLIATALLASSGVTAVSLYIALMSLLTLICAWLAPETRGSVSNN